MIVMVCIDDNGGMLFNHRRQSRDRVLRDKILSISSGHRLWMNHYSAKQFDAEHIPALNIDDSFMTESQDGEYCFVENIPILPYEEWIEEIVLFRWNRVYPADVYFDVPLVEHGWHCVSTEEFSGHSHEKITMEVYRR